MYGALGTAAQRANLDEFLLPAKSPDDVSGFQAMLTSVTDLSQSAEAYTVLKKLLHTVFHGMKLAHQFLTCSGVSASGNDREQLAKALPGRNAPAWGC